MRWKCLVHRRFLYQNYCIRFDWQGSQNNAPARSEELFTIPALSAICQYFAPIATDLALLSLIPIPSNVTNSLWFVSPNQKSDPLFRIKSQRYSIDGKKGNKVLSNRPWSRQQDTVSCTWWQQSADAYRKQQGPCGSQFLTLPWRHPELSLLTLRAPLFNTNFWTKFRNSDYSDFGEN